MDKNPPASSGDRGSTPDLRRFHKPRSNQPVCHSYWAHTLRPRSCSDRAQVPRLLKPVCLEPMPCKKRSHCDEKPVPSALNTQRILWAQGQILKDDTFGCSHPTDLVAQMPKNLPLMWDTKVQSLGWEVPLEKRMARIPWTEEPERPTFSPRWSGSRCKHRALIVRADPGQSALGQPRGSWGLGV